MNSYQKPAALYFEAHSRGGERLSGDNPVGNQRRWEAAAAVEQSGITSMFNLSVETVAKIQRVLAAYNRGKDVIVTLRGKPWDWAL